MSKREPSTSITQLVKTVAKEVVEETLNREEIREDIALLQQMQQQQKPIVDISHFLEEMKSSLDNAWQHWEKQEHELLISELSVAIAIIARNHKRSVGAITARVMKEKLMEQIYG